MPVCFETSRSIGSKEDRYQKKLREYWTKKLKAKSAFQISMLFTLFYSNEIFAHTPYLPLSIYTNI